jgi:hypothetical protein
MIWIFCIFIFFLSSCEQKPQEIHYREIIIETPQLDTANVFSWELPQGWKEVAAKGDTRLASFQSIAAPQTIDCYITVLAGPAGGMDANVERWLGQLNLQASDDNLKKIFISSQTLKTKDGLGIKVFDFTALQTPGHLLDKSMLAAIIALDEKTVFVKMTGSMESVQQNKGNFLKLLGSFVRK